MTPTLSPRSAARLSALLMTMLLIGLLLITLNTVVRNSSTASDMRQAVLVGGLYGEISNQISLSAMFMANYQQSGDRGDLAKFSEAATRAYAYAAQIRETGTDADRAALQALAEKYAAALVRAQARLNEAASGASSFDPVSTTTISEIAADIAALAQDRRQEALARVESFDKDLRSQTLATIIELVLGLPLIAALYFVTRHYERKGLEHELEVTLLKQAALTDGLTRLANHRAFQEDLQREVSRAARTDSSLSVAMIDVDDFKEINDSRGHAQGDLVLAELAQLMSILRVQDRAYRVGGDEFGLIMLDTNEAGAIEAMLRLNSSVAKSLRGATISIGISTAMHGQFDAEVLRVHADAALYEAKHRGKNQVVAYQSELEFATDMSAAKMQAMRRVLESGEVEMWFQPIFHVDLTRLLAFEALLRLPREPALAGPAEAFTITRHMGRTRELDMLCISRALGSAKDLPPGSSLFVNIDQGTLFDSDFSAIQLLDLVRGQEIAPASVVFELTEVTAMPIARLVKQVDALRACGFGVALNDVGAGNAGLEMMRVLKVDYVKVDHSVVLDAINGGPGRAIMLAIAAFARETNTFMIAEGIETTEMLNSIQFDEQDLRKFGTQGVQGFFLGEPITSIKGFVEGWTRSQEGRVA